MEAVRFTQKDGDLLLSSGGAVVSASELSDTAVDFVALGINVGDFLVIPSGLNAGVYTISVVNTTTLEVSEAFPSPPENVIYEVRRGTDILADRYWRDVPRVDPNTKVEKLNSLGTVSNGPRLSINAGFADASRC